ncbi:HNH endonuclease signature motif containing protein [Micromonospora sp. NPDC049891]|uniref:HNH endonuclease signature motif containing protein n=1 Tax=Micromonospora sp. NPDC049891 TaxID=3155655 RepID=UPI0034071C84
MLDLPRVERFIAQVRPDASGCWLWTGPLNPAGYGYFAGRGAHRFAYEEFVGPIPPGMHLDHVLAKGCRNRNCVNWVDHLEVVTPRENTLRAPNAASTKFAMRTHCDNGHEFDDLNTKVRRRSNNPDSKVRVCRQCAADRRRQARRDGRERKKVAHLLVHHEPRPGCRLCAEVIA